VDQKPLVFVAVEGSWHGLMRLPKLIALAGAEMVLMCRADAVLADSKFTGRILEVGGSTDDFCRTMLDHLRECGEQYALLMVPDEDLLRELRNLQSFEDPVAHRLYPFTTDKATIDFVHSKLAFMQECGALGVPVAEHRVCESPTDLSEGIASMGFPIVAKAITSSGGSGVRITQNEVQLQDAVGELGFPLALQAFVAGQPFSTEVLYDHGVPVCWSSSKQLNRWPHTLGSITAKQMIDVPNMEPVLAALGRRTNFHGFACVDAIKPSDGGTIVFCEMNPMQGVEATADLRVLKMFGTALGRMLRRQAPLPRKTAVVDPQPVGLFPETFYYLKSNPKKPEAWAVARRSLAHLPYDDRALLFRLCADLVSGMIPRMGLRTLITRVRSNKKKTEFS
jgi:hypothetical protein